MKTIGIAANPQSGKDIRRLFSNATMISNKEKVNVIERIVSAILVTTDDVEIRVMPDKEQFFERVQRDLRGRFPAEAMERILPADFIPLENLEDTTRFAANMEEIGAGALIVMGGDGTSRAAARSFCKVPMIPVSTGTNNAFPAFLEGTSVGLAAAAMVSGIIENPQECIRECKLLEITKNGTPVDVALVDILFTTGISSGSKAVWDVREMKHVVVAQCRPDCIGFSSLVGVAAFSGEDDPWGYCADIGVDDPNYKVPIAAGSIADVRLDSLTKIELGEDLVYDMEYNGILALDGEREVSFAKGDRLEIRLTQNGPRRIRVAEVLRRAAEKGFFRNGNIPE